MVNNLPVMQETRVQSLGQEDSLEESMTTHSSIFSWRIPWTEEPGRLQSVGLQRVGHNWATNTHTHTHTHTLTLQCSGTGSITGRELKSCMPSEKLRVFLQADFLPSEPPGKEAMLREVWKNKEAKKTAQNKNKKTRHTNTLLILLESFVS